MELLVLATLNWRMQAVTPFSFLDYFLNKFKNGDLQMMPLVSRSTGLILNSIQGLLFMIYLQLIVIEEAEPPANDRLHNL